MASPVVQSVSTAAAGTGTTITTNAPSGVAVGNLLVLSIGVNTATTITTPSGWTLVGGIADVSSQTRSSQFYRIADGGGNDTPSVSLGASVAYVAFILRIDGNSDSPLDTSSTTSSTAAPSAPLAAMTTAEADELLISCMTNTAGYSANPSGWTQVADDGSGSAKHRVWRKNAATVGTYGGETVSFPGSSTSSTVLGAFKATAAATDGLMGAGCGV